MASEPANLNYRFRLAGALFLKAGIPDPQNDEKAIDAPFQLRSVSLRPWPSCSPIISKARRCSAAILRELYWRASRAGRADRARETIDQAVREWGAIVADRAGVADHGELGKDLYQLGQSMKDSGPSPRGRRSAPAPVTENQTALADHPSSTGARDALAQTHASLSYAYLELGAYQDEKPSGAL